MGITNTSTHPKREKGKQAQGQSHTSKRKGGTPWCALGKRGTGLVFLEGQ